MPQLGWRKDAHNPQALYLHHWALHEGVTLEIKTKVDLRKYTIPLNVPWDQGNLGSCTGHGIGVNLSARAVEQGVYYKIGERFSSGFIYDGERELEGSSTEDAGAMPEDGFIWSERHGCLIESKYPYHDTLNILPPDSRYDQWSKIWGETGHFRVTGVAGIQAALSVGNFISFGGAWFSKWMDTPSSGIMANVSPDDEVAGGHEICLFGYETVKNKIYFYLLNSWGKGWADGGWGLLPATALTAIKANGGYDAMFPKLPWRK